MASESRSYRARYLRYSSSLGAAATLALVLNLSSCSPSERNFGTPDPNVSGAAGAGGAGEPGGVDGGGGTVGVSGSGGAAGSSGGLPGACEGDAECDDGKGCNGIERCVSNVCVAGEAPCTDAVPDHCENTCTEGSPVQCGATLKDAADAFDVPRLSPEFVDSGTAPSIAWNTKDRYFGVVWSSKDGIQMNGLDETGKPTFSRVVVMPGDSPAIVWGGDSFGVTAHDGGDIGWRRVDGDMSPLGSTLIAGADGFAKQPRIARLGLGNWLVTYHCCSVVSRRLRVRAISAAGVLVDPERELDAADWTALTPRDATVLAATIGIKQTGPGRFDYFLDARKLGTDASQTEKTGLHAVTSPEAMSDVVSAASDIGYGIGWYQSGAASSSFQFMELDLDGKILCGPIDISKSFQPESPRFNVSGMAWRNGNYIAVGSSADGSKSTIDAVHILPGCKFAKRFTLYYTDDADNRLVEPSIAAGAKGFVAVWYTKGTAPSHIDARPIFEKTCN